MDFQLKNEKKNQHQLRETEYCAMHTYPMHYGFNRGKAFHFIAIKTATKFQHLNKREEKHAQKFAVIIEISARRNKYILNAAYYDFHRIKSR